MFNFDIIKVNFYLSTSPPKWEMITKVCAQKRMLPSSYSHSINKVIDRSNERGMERGEFPPGPKLLLGSRNRNCNEKRNNKRYRTIFTAAPVFEYACRDPAY